MYMYTANKTSSFALNCCAVRMKGLPVEIPASKRSCHTTPLTAGASNQVSNDGPDNGTDAVNDRSVLLSRVVFTYCVPY